MKNEKLELLLNKVVEYHKPDEVYVKGFLYKDAYTENYYLKIVETMLGSLVFNQKYYLREGDEEFIKKADKPKLMRVSLKSWHYRLIKYVLRDNAPTPKTMQNGCPYFWLLVFSILVLPFILLFKAVKWLVLLVPKMLFWVLEQMVESWITGLDDEVAYEMHYNGTYSNKVRMPKTAKIFFEKSDDDFFEFFLSKKYKNLNPDDKDYTKKREEMREKWQAWRDDLDKRREEARKLQTQKESEREKQEAIRRENAYQRQLRWEERMRPMREGFQSIGKWFKDTFTVERGRVNLIVKRTKQFMGLVVTLITLAFTAVVVNYVALGLMWFIDLCIANYWVLVGIVATGAVFGLLYLLYVLISSWVETILNRYKRGKKVWYVQPFIYLIFYPLKYLFMAIAWVVVKILWEIVKFIFYTAIFKYFLKPIGLFIAKIVVGLVKGIGSSTGIFGEYFGASYSDYCPGIEWCDIDEE